LPEPDGGGTGSGEGGGRARAASQQGLRPPSRRIREKGEGAQGDSGGYLYYAMVLRSHSANAAHSHRSMVPVRQHR